VVVASDLDRTLIFSPRAAARGSAREARSVEVLDGEVISLLSARTEQGITELSRRSCFVAVTTRTRAQYERIDLPFSARYAVVACGGVILIDGQPDPAWSRTVARRLAEQASPLALLREVLVGYSDRPWFLRLRDADGLFLVAAVEADHLGAGQQDEIDASCDAHGWRAVHQGRKLYVLPSGLDKADAVAHVAERVGHAGGTLPRVLAAGDTLLDWKMLTAADRAWIPAGSELDRLGMSGAHVTRTAEPGLAAAEEIVGRWLDLLPAQG
jgi:hypothetical protein